MSNLLGVPSRAPIRIYLAFQSCVYYLPTSSSSLLPPPLKANKLGSIPSYCLVGRKANTLDKLMQGISKEDNHTHTPALTGYVLVVTRAGAPAHFVRSFRDPAAPHTNLALPPPPPLAWWAGVV